MPGPLYRYRDDEGAWVVVEEWADVPLRYQPEAEPVVLPGLGAGSGRMEDPIPASGRAEQRAAAEEDPVVRGPGLEVPGLAAKPARSSWLGDALGGLHAPSFGVGFGLGLGVFVVYAGLKRSGTRITRLALLALVVLLVGASVAGMWVAPNVPGAPEWLLTPDELVREARRVAEEAAPEKRLGDLR